VTDATKTSSQSASNGSTRGNGAANGETDADVVDATDLQDEADGGNSVPTVESVAAERDSYIDQLQRTLAEFANYRRRVDQERIHAREVATRDLLGQLVPIEDDLLRALKSIADEHRETSWVQGVQMIERKLAALLDREGVTPIDAIGQPFDPALHEAVASDPGSGGQTVVEVYQAGYRHRNNLLRPAMVRVGDKADA